MRVRVTTFQMQEGKLEEGLEILQSTSIPRLRAEPGCLGVIVVSDPVTSSGQVTAFWESQEALEALDDRGFWESQVAEVLFLIAAVPERKVYDVNLLDFDRRLHEPL